MRILCCVFLLCSFIHSGYCEGYTANNEIIDAYYWRDFSGYIPKDAIQGGFEDGQPSYIAQVLFDKLLVPGKIIGSDKKVYFEWGIAQRETNINIKILCTNHPEWFAWVKTIESDFKSHSDKNFVVGGYEPGQKLYIGRVSLNGETIIGKLLVNDNVVLHTTKGGHPQQNYGYEILYYDPKQTGVQVNVKPQVTCACKNYTPITFNYYC